MKDHEAIHEQAELLAQCTPDDVEALAHEAYQNKLFGAVVAGLLFLETRHPETCEHPGRFGCSAPGPQPNLRRDALEDLSDPDREAWAAYWIDLEQQIAALKN